MARPVLMGEFMHTLDEKGRMFVPARWRDELVGQVVVTKGHEQCLYVMTLERFETRRGQLEQLSTNRKVNRDHNRRFFSSASEEAVDRSGRMSIPATLRLYAGLEKEIVVIGVSERAEIWDREMWTRYQEGIPSYEELAEQLD
ncbi:MAG: division/cell wall cluster transcriptional repressor MraZ [Actinomycetota bacterium]